MDFLQGYRYPLMVRLFGLGVTGSTVTIISPPVPAGRIWCVTHFAVEDETNAFTSFRAYLRDPGYDHWLLEDVSLLAGRLYWYDGMIYIPEDRVACVNFVGTTTADVLRVYVNGFQLVQPEDFKPGVPERSV